MIAPKVWNNPWVVHIQNIGTGEHALKYLAQYIFRPAISNKRILEMSDAMVSFGYRDSKTCKWRKMRVEAMEFIRRYLQHVLPRGFVKVRYYGCMPIVIAAYSKKLLRRWFEAQPRSGNNPPQASNPANPGTVHQSRPQHSRTDVPVAASL